MSEYLDKRPDQNNIMDILEVNYYLQLFVFVLF